LDDGVPTVRLDAGPAAPKRTRETGENLTEIVKKYAAEVSEIEKKRAAELERRAQVLVPSSGPEGPALTQELADLDSDIMELIFDLTFTDEQRRECQRRLVEEWKGRTNKQEWVNNTMTWTKLPTYRNYERNLQRTFTQSRLLALFRKPGASERDRWLLKLYASAFEPGSARNPVLVDSDPPLTQLLIDRYRDFLEPILDLSISGGFSAEQRKVLQDYFVADWKKMRAEERQELLSDIQRWSDATSGAIAAEVNKAIPVLRLKLLARLRTAGDQHSQWLLAVAAQERMKFEMMSQIQRQVYQTRLGMAHNIGPGGTWEYNAATGSYDRWVPDR
jgi:hypothetical protein